MDKDYDRAKWLKWDYSENPPQYSSHEDEMPKQTILFQDRESSDNPLDVFSPVRGPRGFGLQVKKILNAQTRMRCFELASKYREYYAAFLPLNEMTKEQFMEEINQPLLDKYGGNPPEEVKLWLRRASIELGFTIFD